MIVFSIGQKVKDLTGDFDIGEIIDIYENHNMGTESMTMLTVMFDDENNIFDRLPEEVKLVS